MTERFLWERYLKPTLQRPPIRFGRKVQDRFVRGMPDVVYCVEGSSGWLELKCIPHWPARATTKVDVGLTTEQAAWLAAWSASGGTAHVLLGVGRECEWLLFDVREVVTPQVRERLEARAIARGSLLSILPLYTALRDRAG